MTERSSSPCLFTRMEMFFHMRSSVRWWETFNYTRHKRRKLISRIHGEGRRVGQNPIIQSTVVDFCARRGKYSTAAGALVAEGSVILMGHPRANPEGSDSVALNACPIDSTRRNRIPLIANLWRRVQNRAEDGKNTAPLPTQNVIPRRQAKNKPWETLVRIIVSPMLSIYHKCWRDLGLLVTHKQVFIQYVIQRNIISRVSANGKQKFTPLCARMSLQRYLFPIFPVSFNSHIFFNSRLLTPRVS